MRVVSEQYTTKPHSRHCAPLKFLESRIRRSILMLPSSCDHTGNPCPNPHCPVDRGVFTMRGLFQHLDKSVFCRQYMSSLSARTTASHNNLHKRAQVPSPSEFIEASRASGRPIPQMDSRVSSEYPPPHDDDPYRHDDDMFQDDDSGSCDIPFPDAQPLIQTEFHDLIENYVPSNIAQSRQRTQEGNITHFHHASAGTDDGSETSLSHERAVDYSDDDCSTDSCVSSVTEIQENIPVDIVDLGDPDESEDDSDASVASSSNLSDRYSGGSHSDNDIVLLDNEYPEDAEFCDVNNEEAAPAEGNHDDSNVSSSPLPRPPITFDYEEHQDGSYTPRKWIQEWIDWSQDCCSGQSNGSGVVDDETLLPDDISLLQWLLSDPNYLFGWHYISESQRAEITLMNSLNHIKGCPLYVYDTVVEWARSTLLSPINSLDYDSPLPLIRSREKFLKSAETFAHTQNMKPVTSTVKLPGCLKQVSLTTMSYLGNLYNFLTNPSLVNDHTLLIPGETPHDLLPLETPSNYDDVDSGSRFQDSFRFMKKDDIDFPLGDLFFVDKSHLDLSGRLCAEPVNHTFALVNRETRYKPDSWYSIGFIPDQSSHNYKSGDNNKSRDYHFVLKKIFAEYQRIQTQFSGILWPLLYKGKLYMIRLRPYVFACLGDTPGQNSMCGKMGSHKCQRICRYCEIEKKYLGHSWVSAPLMTKERYREIQTNDALRSSHSYKLVDLVWDELWFGVPHESIHTNVPGELLHQFQKGLLVYILEVLTKTQCQSVPGMREEYERLVRVQNNEKGALREIPLEQTKSELVFGGATQQKVDNLSRALGVMLTHQSEHNLPRTHFTQGVVNSSKTTASEQQGIALLFNIILCSTWAVEEQGLALRIGLEKTGDFIKILERLLCLEELLKCHSGKSDVLMTKHNLPQIVLYTEVLLTEIKDKTGRLEGEGFNTVKFHLMTHMLKLGVPMYGSPANVSGGPGESQFKRNLKNPGSTTQQNDSTFSEQVSIRKHQHHTAERCALRVARRRDHETRGLFPGKPYLLNPLHEGGITSVEELSRDHFGSVLRKTETFIQAVTKNAEQDLTGTAGGLTGQHYVFFESDRKAERGNHQLTDVAFCGKRKSSRFKLFTGAVDHQPGHLLDLNGENVGTKGCPGLRGYNPGFGCIADFLQGIFGYGRFKKRIPLFTQFRVQPTRFQDRCTLYRADPCCYVGYKERYDWALFQTKKGLRVGQILSFLRMDTEMIATYNIHKGAVLGSIENEPGVYALVQLLSKEIPGLVEPSLHKHASRDVMQANSTLCFYGKKQLTGRGKPMTRLLPVYKILRPLVVFPDIHPAFSTSSNGCKILDLNINETRQHSFTVLRPRDLWHQVFINEAMRFYDGLGVNGEEVYRKRAGKDALVQAAKEHEVYLAKEKASLEKRRLTSKLKKDAKAAAGPSNTASNTKTSASAVTRNSNSNNGEYSTPRTVGRTVASTVNNRSDNHRPKKSNAKSAPSRSAASKTPQLSRSQRASKRTENRP